MTDKATKTISLALYRYMCQNIVGTENHVKTLRLMKTVRDNISNRKHATRITSGSFGEGLDMRGSDLDRMIVVKRFEVYDDIKTAYNSNVIYLSMKTEDVKAGFSQLLVEHPEQYICKYFEELNGKTYFSSALYRDELLNNAESIVHGPCISNKDGMFDNVTCFHCKTWISQASQWITRSNNSWPSYNAKQSIIKHGVLFVPIGVKGSPKEDIEWRISFSVGEQFLINTFTHTQLICYALMKILLKDVITTYSECEDLLCSYFLKTIIFWISEELPQSIWKPENLIHCFMRCFSRLVYSVDYSVCLHYFIPENNMFENKIEERPREILLETLSNLYSYGWRCMLFSDRLSNFHVSMWMDYIEPHTLHTIEVAKILNSKLLYLANITNLTSVWDTGAYKQGIHQIVSCYQSSLKYLYTYYLSLVCDKVAQAIPLYSARSSNKKQYKQYKSRMCSLLQNIYHDAVSGWLMLASFFYKTKHYQKALHIIMYSLSKSTPEKLCNFMDKSDIDVRLPKLKSFHKKSIVQLWKLMLVDDVIFFRHSELIPDELRIEKELGHVCHHIPSIFYGYFLNFLCHYRLNNVGKFQDCIRDFQLAIPRIDFIKDSENIAQAYGFLGISLQMSGDIESARQAFVQSVAIYPNHPSEMRLALMAHL